MFSKHTSFTIKEKYSRQAIYFTVLGSIFFFILDKSKISKGLILGSVFSILNFNLISLFLHTKLRNNFGKMKATFFSLGSLFFRYAGMAIPLLVAIKINEFCIIGTVIGLFMIQFVIIINQLPNFISSMNK